MIDSTSFFFSWFLVLALGGAILYVVDRNIGKRIYRWFYDMTHQHPLPADIERGFLYERKAQSRFAMAVLISLLQSFFVVLLRVSTVPNETLSVIVEVPCLMLGFAMGPMLYNFWSRREKVFETVDQLENGTLSVKAEVREISEKAMAKIKEAVAPEKDVALKTPVAETRREEPEVDPSAMMSKYLRR